MKTSALAIKSREFLSLATNVGFLAALLFFALTSAASANDSEGSNSNLLKPSPPIPVAFVISQGAVVIDFCGPWEVFRDVMLPSGDHPFRLYTSRTKSHRSLLVAV